MPLTIVIDLDETLIHTADNRTRGPGGSVPLTRKHVITLGRDVLETRIRPGAISLLAFLKSLSPFVRMGVWTAATRPYAVKVLDLLMPTWRRDMSFLRTRSDCSQRGRRLVKDLRALRLPADDVVLIDDNPDHQAFNTAHGFEVIRAPPFFGDARDRFLSTVRRKLGHRVRRA